MRLHSVSTTLQKSYKIIQGNELKLIKCRGWGNKRWGEKTSFHSGMFTIRELAKFNH